MLSVVHVVTYTVTYTRTAECHYADCFYAECHGTAETSKIADLEIPENFFLILSFIRKTTKGTSNMKLLTFLFNYLL
jgi:hypothetical protein